MPCLNGTQRRSATQVLCSAGTDLCTPFLGVVWISSVSRGCGEEAMADQNAEKSLETKGEFAV